MNLNRIVKFMPKHTRIVSIPIRDLMNLNPLHDEPGLIWFQVSIPIRDLMNLNLTSVPFALPTFLFQSLLGI